MDVISQSEILLRLFLTLVIAFVLWLERELKRQPAGIRTHILIWVGSCLLMILSIMVPEIYNSNINDPGRIAAQVVSGVWFLWAWAIMKIGMDTKWLTTAANIWVTAALGLSIWAGLYFASIVVAILILINLVVIAKVKKNYFRQKRNCIIDISVLKKHGWAERLHHEISKLPIDIISKNIDENKKEIKIYIVCVMHKETSIFKLKWAIQKMTTLEKISISENLRQK